MPATDVTSSIDWTQFCDARLEQVPRANLPQRLKLPRTPRAVAQFLRMADRADTDIPALAALIETDPELTAQVLRQVNSCAANLNHRVYSVRHAISLLGLRRSRMLIMSAALQTAMRTSAWYMAHGEQFQAECLERALFARQTAEVLGLDADIAYAAGLVQDLLLPFFLDSCPEKYLAFAERRERLVSSELEELGWSHSAATAHFLRGWNFPDEMVACVLTHHDIEQILADQDLLGSPLIATAAAALLPESLRQEPQGIARLMGLQEELPEFDFLEIAARVDDQFERTGALSGRRSSLCERLGKLAVAHVEGRPRDDWVGRNIGAYVLEERLGEGGMGIVYRARHISLHRDAAVKLMKMSRLDQLQLEKFEREAELTARLTSPHTTTVFDHGQTLGGVPYFIMELLNGITLWELVERFGPQPQGRVIHILRQICLSLTEAHSKGLIHRDIKPDNIVLCEQGGVCDFVKVLDFGLATLIAQPAGVQSSVCGTPHYMSPEAILTPQNVDERTDVYGVGAVGYALLCGCTLFPGSDVSTVLRKQLSEQPVPVSRRTNRPVSPELEALILQCLAKDPDQRPATIQQIAERLLECPAAGEWTADAARSWWSVHGVGSAHCAEQVAHSTRMLTGVGRIAVTGDSARDTMVCSPGDIMAIELF